MIHVRLLFDFSCKVLKLDHNQWDGTKHFRFIRFAFENAVLRLG